MKTKAIILSLIAVIFILLSYYKELNFTPIYLQGDSLVFRNDSSFVRRTWSAYGTSRQRISYAIPKSINSKAQRFRDNGIIHPKAYSDEEYWGSIYFQIYTDQKTELDFFIDTLSALRQKENYDRNQFAKVIVSFVQDIPYTLVLGNRKCEDQTEYTGPCISDTKYGLYSPVEFLYHLKGDCDTRTLLLYSVLKQFNYNPIILTSREYAHAILALDIQASGDFILHNGKKYYFWETTSKGWEAGMLPPSSRNKSYWKKTLI